VAAAAALVAAAAALVAAAAAVCAPTYDRTERTLFLYCSRTCALFRTDSVVSSFNIKKVSLSISRKM